MIAQTDLVQAVRGNLQLPLDPFADLLPSAAADGVQPHLGGMVGLGIGGGAIIGGINRRSRLAQRVLRLQQHLHGLRLYAGMGSAVFLIGRQRFLAQQAHIVDHQRIAQIGQRDGVFALIQEDRRFTGGVIAVRQQRLSPDKALHLLGTQVIARAGTLRRAFVHPHAVQGRDSLAIAVGLAVHRQGKLHVNALALQGVIAHQQAIIPCSRRIHFQGQLTIRIKAHDLLAAFIGRQHLAAAAVSHDIHGTQSIRRCGARQIANFTNRPCHLADAVISQTNKYGKQQRNRYQDCGYFADVLHGDTSESL